MTLKPIFAPISKTWDILTNKEKKRAFFIFGLMIIGMLLETLSIGLIVPVIGLLTQENLMSEYSASKYMFDVIGKPDQLTLITGAMVILVVLYLIKTLFLAVLAWLQTSFAYGVQAQLSQKLFNVYLQQSYAFHLQRNSAQLIRNVINEVGMFAGNAILPSMMLLTEMLVLIAICVLLLIVEPIGTLLIIGTVIVALSIFYYFITRHATSWGKTRQYHDGLRIQHLQQGLGGAKEVKLSGCENIFLENYNVHNWASAHIAQMQTTSQQLPRLWLEFLAISGLSCLVISMMFQNRSIELILPILGLFAAAAFRLLPSVNRLLSAIQSLKFGIPVVHELEKELKLPIYEITQVANRVIKLAESIELKNVNFIYPGTAALALNSVNLSIKQGESIGLVGKSGAGKSTLVDVMLGLLKPTSGEVLVDSTNIQSGLRAWQSQIGYVPQVIFLTDDTLERNIAFGISEENINKAAVSNAIDAAQLTEFVAGLPAGLQTVVGERGVRLSGGQRQRIGIARALYHDPSVLFLDEATSSLDTATEHDFMQAVRNIQHNKTVIIVAHRMSTVEYCNRIYRLDKGQIVQESLSVPSQSL